jgi:hypothetical protein
MKEHPILFSAPMILALLAGRKTQTRRVLKYQPSDAEVAREHGRGGSFCIEAGFCGARFPFGVPGDRLWVKETWHPSARIGADIVEIEYLADESTREIVPPSDFMWERWDDKWIRGGWRPSLFMSRWMSRITLEVTAVRAQRVQDISEEDALAEGVERRRDVFHPLIQSSIHNPGRRGFAVLWDSINGKRPGCSWADNPWCWCISFRRIPDEARRTG